MSRAAASCRFALCIAVALLGACAGIPHGSAPLPQRDALSADIERAPDSPRGDWPDSQWWKSYGDDQLDALIERALIGAPSMDTAAARLRLAERSVDAARAQLGPDVALDASLTREKLSHFGLIPPPYGGKTIDDAEVKLGFSYDFDWWGKNRAALAAALDEQRASEADRAAAATVLVSSVAQQYFAWQAAQARVALGQRMLDEREHYIRLLRLRRNHDLESDTTIGIAESQRDSTRQNLAALSTSQRLIREQLRALLGATPGTLAELTPAPLPTEDRGVPSHLGLDLVARRPDVIASRLRIEAQARRIDAAQAQFYPDINLSAFLGLSTVQLSKLLDKDSLTAGVAPALHLPIFDAGRLRANLGINRANLDVAIAAYNQAVVDAATDVAMQVATLTGLIEQCQAAQASLRADESVRGETAARVRQGLADARDEIDAELPVLTQQDLIAQLDAQRLGAQIALIKALGGGYRSDAADVAAQETH